MDGVFHAWGQQIHPLIQPAIWIGILALIIAVVFSALMTLVGSGKRQRGLERVGRGMLFEVLSWLAGIAWAVVMSSSIVVFLGFYLPSV